MVKSCRCFPFNQAKTYMLSSVRRYCFPEKTKKMDCIHTALKSTVDLSVHLPVLKHLPLKWKTTSLYAHPCKRCSLDGAQHQTDGRRTEATKLRSPPARLTPSQHVVPEQMLLPDEDGHDDERVEVDALTQHPEVVGAGCVLRQHSQDLTDHLRGRRQGGASGA